jgi:ATP-binding cassette subfamily B protein
VVKAFARQDYEIDKFQKANWEKFLRGKRLNIMHSLFWPVSDTICGLQILAGILLVPPWQSMVKSVLELTLRMLA